MTNYFKNLRTKLEHKRRKEQQVDILNRFSVEERNDALYIMCGNSAIHQIPAIATASEILQKLKDCRNDALKHDCLV